MTLLERAQEDLQVGFNYHFGPDSPYTSGDWLIHHDGHEYEVQWDVDTHTLTLVESFFDEDGYPIGQDEIKFKLKLKLTKVEK